MYVQRGLVVERSRRFLSRLDTPSKKNLIVCVIALLAALTLSSCLEPVAPDLKNSSWVRMNVDTKANLRGVYGIETGEVFAVGDGGTIVFFDGANWLQMPSGTTADLVGVWAGSVDNAFATGANGTVLHYDGVSWSAMNSGTSGDIGAIWGIEIAPWMQGQLPAWLYAVGGAPGTVLQFDGREWQSMNTGGSDALIDIMGWLPPMGGWPPVVMAVGANGSARFFDGFEWSGTDTGVSEDLVALFGDAPDNVFAVGRNGTVIQNTERFVAGVGTGSWRQAGRVASSELSDMAARGYNDLFLVGADGSTVNFDRLQFRDLGSAGEALRAVWAGDRYVYAVGDNGTIVRYSQGPKHERCPINVRVSAEAGALPVIDWSPPCPVSKIVIEDTYSDVQWFAETDGNLIYPNVEWGTAPPGTVERRMSMGPLIGNSLYRVSLYRRDWDREILIGAWNVIPDDSPNGVSVTLAPSDMDYDARIFHFQRLQPTGTGPNVYRFGGVAKIPNDNWRTFADPAERETALNVRTVILEVLERDRETGQLLLFVYRNVRLAEMPVRRGTVEVLWDWGDN